MLLLITLIVSAILVLGLSGLLAAAVLFPVREKATLDPSDFGLSYERISFDTLSGARLCGWFLPNPNANGRTVVVLHGVCSNKSQMLEHGVELFGLGYNVLLLDQRRHGESTGGMTTYGVLESQDLRCVLDQLMLRPDVSLDGVALVGYSMGAAVALQTLDHEHVRTVVADSAFSDLHSVIAHRGRQWFVPGPIQRLSERIVIRVARFQYQDVSPMQCLARSSKSVFLIHGERDNSVPVEHSERMAEMAPGRVTLWKVPLAAHIKSSLLCPREYYRKIGSFLAEHYVCQSFEGVPEPEPLLVA